jgi:hypothetical protein
MHKPQLPMPGALEWPIVIGTPNVVLAHLLQSTWVVV